MRAGYLSNVLSGFFEQSSQKLLCSGWGLGSRCGNINITRIQTENWSEFLYEVISFFGLNRNLRIINKAILIESENYLPSIFLELFYNARFSSLSQTHEEIKERDYFMGLTQLSVEL